MKLPFGYEIVKKHKVTIIWYDNSGFRKTIEGYGLSYQLFHDMFLYVEKATKVDWKVTWKPCLVRTVNSVTGVGDSDLW